MNIAVISCIHGNYEALIAVLRDIDAHGAEQIVCLGDLVGYGPYPHGVVALIQSLEIPVVQGCWDEDVTHGLNACECSYPSLLAERRGRLAHEWTVQHLHPESLDYLAGLPKVYRQGTLGFVHGSPYSQHEYLLPDLDGLLALERVIAADVEVLFCGHTHIPYDRTLVDGTLTVRVNGVSQTITAPPKRIINVGSVGEPRHGRPHATYVLYDTDSGVATLREVPYDYQRTCAALVELGLPSIFAWRLSQGMEFAERAEDASHLCGRGVT
jgi:diadenosine tetraphosphatase ApaH/serine/threonine PP2A family protein phosphatase